MTQQEIDKQVELIKSFTDSLIKKGPEACKAFLVKIGVINEAGKEICRHTNSDFIDVVGEVWCDDCKQWID